MNALPLNRELIKNIMRAIETVIERGRAALWIAVRQRASFEGWLKLELAYELETAGFRGVRLEEAYRGGRADIAFSIDGGRCYIELKTCPTQWEVRGVSEISRPPKRRVKEPFDEGVGKMKLINTPDIGLFIMLLFPANLKVNIVSKIRGWKFGDELLGEKPLLKMIKMTDEVGIAVLLFGPYQDGKLVREPEGLQGSLTDLSFDGGKIEETRNLSEA